MLTIDSSHVHGEPGTGYEGPEGGPFKCGNCKYFRDGSCGQPTMMERSKLLKAENGRVLVDEGGCCEYVERKTKAGAHSAGKRMMRRGK